jgi:hypothetical protein
MSDAVQNIMLDILKRIQGDNAEFRRVVEARFDRLEEIVRKQRRDSAGMLVMMRATASDFDERVSEIEERMDALEGRSG